MRDQLILFIILIFAYPVNSSGQGKLDFIRDGQTSYEIPFQMTQNLIVIPASVNKSQRLNFILDTGISNTIITELTGVDTVDLSDARLVRIEGLGDGEPLKTWYSHNNVLTLEDPFLRGSGMIGREMEVYVITEDRFEFSKQFGLQINGLVGSEFFTNFVVEIDYIHKSVTFTKRENFNFKKKTRRHSEIPLTIENDRPFIKVRVFQDDGSEMDVKLLIDTGASMALWLSVYSDDKIKKPEITFPALLGQGLNGDIKGVNGRIPKIVIGDFEIYDPIVAYPDSLGIAGMTNDRERNGTLGNEILKRFHVYLDYEGSRCYLLPNKNFKQPFNYNRSGLEIEKPFYNLPIYHVYNVVSGSPAEIAGIKPGDQIEMINHRRATNIELNEINSILYGTEGRSVRLHILRDGEIIKTKLSLDYKL